MSVVKQELEQSLSIDLSAKFLRGLGDSNRLRILELLIEKERNVNELVKILKAPQGRVSNHLACLRWCGYVSTERKGKYIYYKVTDNRVRQIIELAKQIMADNSEHIEACQRI